MKYEPVRIPSQFIPQKYGFFPNLPCKTLLPSRSGSIKRNAAFSERSTKPSVKTSEKIKELMRSNPTVTIKEMAETLKRQPRTIEIAISKLKATGDILREGSEKDGTWKVLK